MSVVTSARAEAMEKTIVNSLLPLASLVALYEARLMARDGHTADGQVTVRIPPQMRVAPGERVGLEIQSEHSNWFDQGSGLRLA